MNLMQLPDEYQNDLQGRDGRCYYHEVLLFQGKEEWKKEWKKNKNLRLQSVKPWRWRIEEKRQRSDCKGIPVTEREAWKRLKGDVTVDPRNSFVKEL